MEIQSDEFIQLSPIFFCQVRGKICVMLRANSYDAA